MGAVESLGAVSLAIGLPLGGALVAASSARTAFLVLGLGTAASAIAFVRLTLNGLEPAVFAGPDTPAAELPLAEAGTPVPHEPATK